MLRNVFSLRNQTRSFFVLTQAQLYDIVCTQYEIWLDEEVEVIDYWREILVMEDDDDEERTG